MTVHFVCSRQVTRDSATTKRNNNNEVYGCEISDRLGSLIRNINSSFTHYLDGSRIDIAGFQAGTYYIDGSSS